MRRLALRVGAGVAGALTALSVLLFHLYAPLLVLGLVAAAGWVGCVADRILGGCFVLGWLASLAVAIWGSSSGGYLLTATWQGYLLLLGSLLLFALSVVRISRRASPSRTIDTPNT